MQCLEVRREIQNIFTARIINDLLWDMVESLLLEVLNCKSDVFLETRLGSTTKCEYSPI